MNRSTQQYDLYVIRDDVSKQISPLFYATSQADAERNFKQFLSSPQMQNPADYSLFYIGRFDADSFEIQDSHDHTPAGYLSRVNGATVKLTYGVEDE